MPTIPIKLYEYIAPQWLILYFAIIIAAWFALSYTPIKLPMIILTIIIGIPIYFILTNSLGPENMSQDVPGPKEINAPGQSGLVYWIIAFVPGAALSIIVSLIYKIVYQIKEKIRMKKEG